MAIARAPYPSPPGKLSMYPKNPLFQKCLAYLESLPNIKVTIQGEPYCTREVLADGNLIINTGNQTVDYVCEIKTGLTNDLVEQVQEYFTNLGQRLNPGQRPLLVTRDLSNLVVARLLEKNIEFIDVDGNIYLNRPEIYLLVRDRRSKKSSNKSTNQSLALTPAALQVIYGLLRLPNSMFDREKIDWIARVSGVGTKTAIETLEKLKQLDYIRGKDNRYKIIDRAKLFERWELGYHEILRTKLLIGTFSPSSHHHFSEIEAQIKDYADLYGYLIGGELAASIITQYLRPISATLHLNNNINYREIAVKLKLKPDEEGNIAFFKKIGSDDSWFEASRQHHPKIVHPLLIHAELVCTGNSRLKETARLVYDVCIKENRKGCISNM